MSTADLVRPAGNAGRSRDAIVRQTVIGLGLAALIVIGWTSVHVFGLYRLDLAQTAWWWTLALAALQTWLSVGLFIVAHDAMHGSLAPFRPRLNRVVGRMALLIYAGFNYDRLIGSHFKHHRHAGLDGDPDFDSEHPDRFWPWFTTFFIRYSTIGQLAYMTAFAMVSHLLLGAPVANLTLFWALPALLAALQLFYFGTYRPHRQDDTPFSDRHRARSDDFPAWLSLLTCFHFGYHHEHHSTPDVPWWRLPREHAQAGGDRG